MFLDTANIEQIKKCIKTGVIQGVTTNPTILLKEKTERFEQIKKILDTDIKLLFVQIVGKTADELYSDYEKVSGIKTDKIIAYKVPIDFAGLETIKKIKKNNPDTLVLGTAVYSADQGILGGLAGCDYVAPYVNRMSNNNIDPFEVISTMRTFYEDRNIDCKILAASFKNINQILNSFKAGAYTCTVPADLFMQMVNKELAGSAIKVFNEHAEKLDEMTK